MTTSETPNTALVDAMRDQILQWEAVDHFPSREELVESYLTTLGPAAEDITPEQMRAIKAAAVMARAMRVRVGIDLVDEVVASVSTPGYQIGSVVWLNGWHHDATSGIIDLDTPQTYDEREAVRIATATERVGLGWTFRVTEEA